jgi:hypothetical protein
VFVENLEYVDRMINWSDKTTTYLVLNVWLRFFSYNVLVQHRVRTVTIRLNKPLEIGATPDQVMVMVMAMAMASQLPLPK